MNVDETILSMRDGIARASEVRFAHPLNIDILKGENIAVVGCNGAGKVYWSIRFLDAIR